MIIMLIVVRGSLGAGGARRIIYQEPTMCKELSQRFCIHDLANFILTSGCTPRLQILHQMPNACLSTSLAYALLRLNNRALAF